MKTIFEKMGDFIGRKYLPILVICLVLIVPAAFGATQIENKAPDVDIMVAHDAQEYKDYQRLTENFSETVILLLLTADNTEDLVQRDNILAFDSFEQQMASEPNVAAVIGPAFMIKFAMAPPMGAESVPDDDETILTLLTDPETGAIRDDFARLFPDERHALATIIVESGIEQEDLFDLVDATEAMASDVGFKDATYAVTGLPTHQYETSDKMVDALQMMIGVALILMLVILILVHKVRNFFAWRWFPLGVVFLGIFYTFGIMGLTGIPITPVTIGAFPILIGLGVGITIQFHDRYDKAMVRGESPAGAVIEAITRIGPATGIAVVVVCLGFTALLTSPVPMIVDFGYSLIIGTIVMYLLAVFVLVPILYGNDHRNEVKAVKKACESFLPKWSDSRSLLSCWRLSWAYADIYLTVA